MAIPSLGEVLPALIEELEKAGGTGKAQDIIEKLAQRFKVTSAERNLRDPSGPRTFDHRVHSAVARARLKLGLIEPVKKSGRGIWKLTADGLIAVVQREVKIKSAAEATEVALSFLKQHYRFIPQQPTKAVREDNLWLVEIDVGLLRTRIAKIKIDAKTAAIIEYDIPPEVA